MDKRNKWYFRIFEPKDNNMENMNRQILQMVCAVLVKVYMVIRPDTKAYQQNCKAEKYRQNCNKTGKQHIERTIWDI